MWPKPTKVPAHPRPSPEEHRERGYMRTAASDHTQALVWAWFFVFLAGLLLTGLAFGLRLLP